MKPRDLARILDSYSENITGSEFGQFVLNILELTMKRGSKPESYQINFWRYFLNALSRGALEEIFLPPRFRSGSKEFSEVEPPAGFKVEPDQEETPADRKRRILKEGK